MKYQLQLLFSLIIYSNAYSQNFDWAKRFGGVSGDGNTSVVADGSGNVFVTGWFDAVVDFDPGPGTYTLNAGSGGRDAYVAKFNSLGNFIWAKSFTGTSGGSYDSKIAIDALGNVYSTGNFGGTFDFDPGIGVYNLSSNGVEDIYISKLDANGNFLWAKSFGESNTDYVFSIAIDLNNNIYTTGTFQNTIDFDPNGGVFNLTSNGLDDNFICKIDQNGNFQWAKKVGSTSNDVAKSIAIDNSGNACIAGYYSGTVDFDPNGGVFNQTSGASLGSIDEFVWKLDINGDLFG